MSKPDAMFVLGAGPGGLAAAYTLNRLGSRVLVVERDSTVGGLAKSFDFNGFTLDYGPHFFITDHPLLLQLWNEVLGPNQLRIPRLTRMQWRGHLLDYPPSPRQLLEAVGLSECLAIAWSYIVTSFGEKRPPRTLADQLTCRYGARLYQTFFKPYIEKLWNESCCNLAAEWEPGRIYKSSIWRTISTFLHQKDGSFLYPKLGSRQFYESIAALLHREEQEIFFRTEISEIHCDDFTVTSIVLKNIETKAEEKHSCRGVVSSIPLPVLLRSMRPKCPQSLLAAVESLSFRSVVLVYLFINRKPIFEGQCIYVANAELRLARVTNCANWSPYTLGDTATTPLCCEYWCDVGDALWTLTDGELCALALRELGSLGLLNRELVSNSKVVRLPRTHPAYKNGYRATVDAATDYLKQFTNLKTVGRTGAFRYLDQDDVLTMGITAAESLAHR